MALRVISGTAKGRRLKSVPGDGTRPILDRIKENLFNLISSDYIVDQRWLDLFAGTGSIGIEALSRGAAHCTFIDNERQAIGTIQENLGLTNLQERAEVRHADAFQVLSAASPDPFDLIYVGPPQYLDLWTKAMSGIDDNIENLLVPDGIVVVQIDPKEYSELPLTNLREYKSRTYGRTQLIFYERP